MQYCRLKHDLFFKYLYMSTCWGFEGVTNLLPLNRGKLNHIYTGFAIQNHSD